MSTKHAVLGLVDERPGYPYEIANRFQHRVGPPWQLNNALVYQAVNQMKREGLVAVSPRGRRQYVEATDQGREELRRWRDAPTTRVPPVRDPLLLKLFAARLPEHAPQLLRDIEERERTTMQLIEDYSQRLQPIGCGDRALWPEEVPDLALTMAIEHLQADLAWLGSARARIIARLGPSSGHCPAQTRG